MEVSIMIITKKLGYVAISVASLFAISLPFTMQAVAQAQTGNDQNRFQRTQGAPPQGGGFQQGPPGAGPNGQPGQGQFRPGGGMMGGGGAAITSDNMFLYVVQGNMVFKIGKGDLKVVGESQLM